MIVPYVTYHPYTIPTVVNGVYQPYAVPVPVVNSIIHYPVISWVPVGAI